LPKAGRAIGRVVAFVIGDNLRQQNAEAGQQGHRERAYEDRRAAPPRPGALGAVAGEDGAVGAAVETHAQSAFFLEDQVLRLTPRQGGEVIDTARTLGAMTHALVAVHVVPRNMARRGHAKRIEIQNCLWHDFPDRKAETKRFFPTTMMFQVARKGNRNFKEGMREVYHLPSSKPLKSFQLFPGDAG